MMLRKIQGCFPDRKEKLCESPDGSFTVEAVFLFPIIIFLIALILQVSVSWYQGACAAARDIETVRELDTQGYFRKQMGEFNEN